VSDPLLLTDLLKLDTGASGILDLYEIQIDDSDWLYVTPYNETTGPVVGSPATADWMVQFRDFTNGAQINNYVPVPCSLEGIEHKSDGPLPQPKFVISNIFRPGPSAPTSFEGLLAGFTFKQILGNKIIRRRTMQKYLYGETGDSNPPVEFIREEYILDRIEDENPQTITFSLVSPIDLENVKIPNRIVVGNACPWKYTAAGVDKNEWEKSGGCTWPSDGSIELGGTTTNIYVSIDDYYIILNASGSEWSSGEKPIHTVVYTVDKTVFKVQPNGNLSYDVLFDGADVSPGNDTITATNNFVTGDYVVFEQGSGSIGGLSDNSKHFVNVNGNTITLYNTEANAIAGGATGRRDLGSSSGSNHTLVTAVRRYWKAKVTTSEDPASSTQNTWETIHRAVAYAANVPIQVFTDDLFNTIVIYNSRAWKGSATSQAPNEHILANPELGTYWDYGDFCGKRLTSCAKRFGANVLTSMTIGGGASIVAGNVISGDDSEAVAKVESKSGSVLTLTYVTGVFEVGETIRNGSDDTGTVSSFSISAPVIDTYPAAVLPFGAFPTARAFDGA
jgi:phage-related protein